MKTIKRAVPPYVPPRPKSEAGPEWNTYLEARADSNQFYIKRGTRRYWQGAMAIVVAFGIFAGGLWKTQSDLDSTQRDQQTQRQQQTREACTYRNAQSAVILAGARRLKIKLTPDQLRKLGPEDCDKRVKRLAP